MLHVAPAVESTPLRGVSLSSHPQHAHATQHLSQAPAWANASADSVHSANGSGLRGDASKHGSISLSYPVRCVAAMVQSMHP
eukprot:10769313-Alexandrium_andersonii.AAC.1